MPNMQLLCVEEKDVALWWELSREFDAYVRELVGDLTQWYHGSGNGTDLAFAAYMKSKIAKKEAVMAVKDSECQGVIAFSRANNRITFFGVSHRADFAYVSRSLVDHALGQLNAEKPISVNVMQSSAEMMVQERRMFAEYGFVFCGEGTENGVPIDKLCKF